MPIRMNAATSEPRTGMVPGPGCWPHGWRLSFSMSRSFRDGTLGAELFTSYQRSEQALLLSLMEMVIQGVSTRKISEITETLCGTSFSKSTVSALCEQLDPVVESSSESSALPALSVPGGGCHLYESPGATPDRFQKLPDCHRGERRGDTGGARFHCR